MSEEAVEQEQEQEQGGQVDELAAFVAGRGTSTPTPEVPSVEKPVAEVGGNEALEVEEPQDEGEPIQDGVDTETEEEVAEEVEEGDAEGVEDGGDEPGEVETKLEEALALNAQLEARNKNLFAMLNEVPIDPLNQASASTNVEGGETRSQAQTPTQEQARTQPAAPVAPPLPVAMPELTEETHQELLADPAKFSQYIAANAQFVREQTMREIGPMMYRVVQNDREVAGFFAAEENADLRPIEQYVKRVGHAYELQHHGVPPGEILNVVGAAVRRQLAVEMVAEVKEKKEAAKSVKRPAFAKGGKGARKPRKPKVKSEEASEQEEVDALTAFAKRQ